MDKTIISSKEKTKSCTGKVSYQSLSHNPAVNEVSIVTVM